MRYVYLHGFASGPQSRKAQAFRADFAARGIEVETPDLAGGDFEHLTLSGQLRRIEGLLSGKPVRLIGSSMGGYLAALYAESHPEVDRLVLLAPAFALASRWKEMMGADQMSEWRDLGWLPVFHYGDKTERRVHFGLFEDSRQLPPNPGFIQPAVIFHGFRDTTVPIEFSRAYVSKHPNVILTEYDSDHELLNVLPEMLSAANSFLGDGIAVPG